MNIQLQYADRFCKLETIKNMAVNTADRVLFNRVVAIQNKLARKAILKLKSICILTTVETGFYRGSGSIGFHHFLLFNRINTFGGYIKGIDECDNKDTPYSAGFDIFSPGTAR